MTHPLPPLKRGVPSLIVIQRSFATKNLECIHLYVPEILRFALDDKILSVVKMTISSHI